MTVIVFPGQGSQYPLMAMDFNENFHFSSKIFEEIEDYTKINIRKIISKNEDNQLNQTNFTQIAIFAASIVIYKTLINEIGFEIIDPKIVLGHSLGEYTALVANNTLSLFDASNLIKIRGELMNSAIKPNLSGMAAIIGKNANFINTVIKNNKLNIEIANDNSLMQVVVSGLMEDIESAEKIFILEGVKKYIKLNVSAAFHSQYMKEAQNKLNSEIIKINFLQTNIPLISNYNACINLDTTSLINSLKKQMSNMVKWTESIKNLEKTEESDIIEIGPGKVLSGLINRITKKFDIISFDKVEDLKKFKNIKL